MNKLICALVLISVLVGCKAEKPTAGSAQPIKPINSEETMIAFLTFRFTINENDSLEISLEDAIWSAGSLRDADEEISDTALQMTFYDVKGELVATKYVDDPLNKEVEYVDDDNSFKRKNVSLKDELLTMRLALPRNIKRIEVKNPFGHEIAKIELK